VNKKNPQRICGLRIQKENMGRILVAAFADLFDISNSGSKAKPMAMPIVPEIESNP